MITYTGIIDERPTLSGEPTKFRLFGFDKEVEQSFRNDLAALETVDEPMTAVTVRDAVLKPLTPKTTDAFSGGVFGPDRRPVEQAVIRRHSLGIVFGFDDEPFPESPPTVRLEKAFWGGVLFTCYGHVILESIARLSPEAIASDLPILFHANAKRSGSEGVFRTVLEFLGVDAARVRFVDEVTLVGELMLPPPWIVLGERLNLAFVRHLREIVRRRIAVPDQPSRRPLLLSRSALKAQVRKPFGEDYLEAQLSPLADIVHPQEHSFARQVELVNASSRFMGFIGSQMHNLLFNASAAPVEALYLSIRRVPRAYLQIDLALGGLRNYVHVARYGAAFDYGRWAPFMVDFKTTEQGLRGSGFIPRRHAVAPEGHAADAMLARYYREWAEGLFRFRFCRPSQFWSASETDSEIARVLDAFRPRLAPALDDPQLRSLIREVAARCFERPRQIDPAIARAFMRGLFEAEEAA